jgi:hypothetical protein
MNNKMDKTNDSKKVLQKKVKMALPAKAGVDLLGIAKKLSAKKFAK